MRRKSILLNAFASLLAIGLTEFCNFRQAIICDRAVLGSGVTVKPGAVLSYDVCLPLAYRCGAA